MRRTATILAAVALMVVLSAGVALATGLTGTDRTDILQGTNQAERISGLGGGDQLYGGGGGDRLMGGTGSDEIGDGRGRDTIRGGDGVDNLIGVGDDTSKDYFYGDGGRDTVQSRDVPAVKDTVRCGADTDTVYADKADFVAGDCEKVKIR